ncbi:uncharacterized protein PODANS_1_16590 [Podospora anserina S mat+]|uniref:Podospora anserina S mat+ genomic DNA chromosome 1, supercontig 4 n=1 Tax=Podospora anserina (strain S / ATCC MYA-4624 / DSM 980 / FGSC 10383) TaxID=515849 RepID=B2ATQ2_PODAN|nr:uncharacterized protein PODANS_1_16590 [Podospora anserina S mat+]CAP67775.1 unnamed protein product [Podospora anserina S mat+]CDP24032.1 Putative protein of unknown function [Podospora anserina S mat+]
MGIADLLGAITGEKPSPSPTSNPTSRHSTTAPKRKAEDDLRNTLPKAPRTETTADGLSRPNISSPKPASRPIDKPTTASGSTYSGSSRPPVKSTTASATRPSTVVTNGTRPGVSSNGSKPLPSRPVANRPSPSDSGPPKKRSFAEIMARARENQEARESLGKISHKPVERNLTMKERKELKADQAKQAKVAGRKGSAAPPASSRTAPKNGVERNRVSPGASSAKAKAAAEEENKKIKKAALATTGYTGTARPRPGATTKPKASSSGPDRDPRDKVHERPRYGGSRSRYEEEDDDLDDFVEYDEDEDDPYAYGRRGGYDDMSDESDMEAGLSDIEVEETAAERRARLEDKQEEEREKRLKREKEERKRKALEAMRASRR